MDEKSKTKRATDRAYRLRKRCLIREFRGGGGGHRERFPGDAFGRIIEKPSDGKIGERRVANRP